MKIETLKVIPEPAPNTRAVLQPSFEGPAMSGPEPVNLLCGGCNRPLTEGVSRTTLRNVVIKCFSCGAFNDTGDVDLQ